EEVARVIAMGSQDPEKRQDPEQVSGPERLAFVARRRGAEAGALPLGRADEPRDREDIEEPSDPEAAEGQVIEEPRRRAPEEEAVEAEEAERREEERVGLHRLQDRRRR